MSFRLRAPKRKYIGKLCHIHKIFLTNQKKNYTQTLGKHDDQYKQTKPIGDAMVTITVLLPYRYGTEAIRKYNRCKTRKDSVDGKSQYFEKKKQNYHLDLHCSHQLEYFSTFQMY